MGGEFVTRVSVGTVIALVPVAVGGALGAGWPGAVGSLAGGLIALAAFRWIARGVSRAVSAGAHGGLALSGLAAGVRHLALFAALAVVLASGVAHPLALVAGLSVLPPMIIVFGLRATEMSA